MAHVRIAPASLPSDRPGRRLQTYAALPVDPAAVQGGMVGLMLGAAIAQLGPDALRWRPRGGTVTHAPPAPQPTVTPAVAPTTLPPLWELVWRPLVPPQEAVHREAVATHAGAAPSAPQLMLEGLTPAARERLLLLALSCIESALRPSTATPPATTPPSARAVLADAATQTCAAWHGAPLPDLDVALLQDEAAAPAMVGSCWQAAADKLPLYEELMSSVSGAAGEGGGVEYAVQPLPQRVDKLVHIAPPPRRRVEEQRARAQRRRLLHTAAVLHDMAVMVAEAVACAYFSHARQGEVEGPPQLLPSLNTSRALERFRNQVLLAQWVDRRWHGVRRVMEDSHRVWLIRVGGRLQPKALAVKRAQELQLLQGAPLAVSLLLEAGDVVGPLLLSLFKQARVVVSWLLVAIIGQALGLVYRGIQHSMRGRDEERKDGAPWWWPPEREAPPPPRQAPPPSREAFSW